MTDHQGELLPEILRTIYGFAGHHHRGDEACIVAFPQLADAIVALLNTRSAPVVVAQPCSHPHLQRVTSQPNVFVARCLDCGLIACDSDFETKSTIDLSQKTEPVVAQPPAEKSQSDNLPSIAGRRCEWSLAEFEQRCQAFIGREQEKPLPDNGLIAVLCNAVRLSREQVDDWATFSARMAAAAPVLPDERVEEIERWLRSYSYHSNPTAVIARAFQEIRYLLSLLPLLEEKKNASQS